MANDANDSQAHLSCSKVDATAKQSTTCELLRTTTYVPDKADQHPTNFDTKPSLREIVIESKSSSKHLPALSTAEINSSKSDSASKTSKMTKKTTAEAGMTSSARARLALKLDILEEQRELEEQKLAVEEELREQRRKCEQELREMELAIEAKILAEQKAFLERKLKQENEFRKRQLEIKKRSSEEKARLIRQVLKCGSSRTTERISLPDSREKVNRKQQTEGAMTASTSADIPGISDQISQEKEAMNQTVSVKHADRKLDLPIPPTLSNKDRLLTRPAHPTLPPLDRPYKIRDSDRNIVQSNQEEGEKENHVGKKAQVVFDDLRSIWNPHFAAGVELLKAHNPNGLEVPSSSNSVLGFVEAAYDESAGHQLAALQDGEFSRLQRCLRNPGLEALELRYSCSVTSIYAVMEHVHQLSHPRVNVFISIVEFSPMVNGLNGIVDFNPAVNNLVEHQRKVDQQSHTPNRLLLFDLVNELPARLLVIRRMKQHAYGTEMRYVVMEKFYLQTASVRRNQMLNDGVFLLVHPNLATLSTEQVVRKICSGNKTEILKLADFLKLKTVAAEETWRVVQHSGLCGACLGLHGGWPLDRMGLSTDMTVTTPARHLDRFRTLETARFVISPVTLIRRMCHVKGFKYSDENFQSALLNDAVADRLGVFGPADPLSLHWTTNRSKNRRTTESKSQCDAAVMSDRCREAGARVVEGFLLPLLSLRRREPAEKHLHLLGQPLQNFEIMASTLLIGLDNMKLVVLRSVKEEKWNYSVNAKCRLGCNVYWYSKAPSTVYASEFYVGGWTDREQELTEMPIESEMDGKLRVLLEPTAGGFPASMRTGFKTGMLWQVDDVTVLNSRRMAMRALERTWEDATTQCGIASRSRPSYKPWPYVHGRVHGYGVVRTCFSGAQWIPKAATCSVVAPGQCWIVVLLVMWCHRRFSHDKHRSADNDMKRLYMDLQMMLYYLDSILVSISNVMHCATMTACLTVDGVAGNRRLRAWRRGRVDTVVDDQERWVQRARVRTKGGLQQKPIVKLAVLDVMEGGKPRPEDYIGLRAGECYDEYPLVTDKQEGICATQPRDGTADSGCAETSKVDDC